MILSPSTICVQVHHSDWVLKHKDKNTCQGEICICFGSAPLVGISLIPLDLYYSYLQMHTPNAISWCITNFVALAHNIITYI